LNPEVIKNSINEVMKDKKILSDVNACELVSDDILKKIDGNRSIKKNTSLKQKRLVKKEIKKA
jgi:hypothetical protein